MSTARGRGRAAVAAFDLAGALAQASWAEADRALIAALAELPGLEAAITKLAAAKTAAAARDAKAALALLSQALSSVARKRGVERFGKVGVTLVYDPARHALETRSARAPAKVKIVAPGFVRSAEVLAKARVTPAPIRKRAP